MKNLWMSGASGMHQVRMDFEHFDASAGANADDKINKKAQADLGFGFSITSKDVVLYCSNGSHPGKLQSPV